MSERKNKQPVLAILIYIVGIVFFVIVALHILAIAYAIISYIVDSNKPPETWVESYHYYEAYTVEDDAIYILKATYSDSYSYIKFDDDVIEEIKVARSVGDETFSEIQPKAKLIAEESHNILANQFTSSFEEGYEHLADEVLSLNIQGLTCEDEKSVGLAFKLFECKGRIYGFVNVYSKGASGRDSVAFENIVKTCLVEFADGKMTVVKEIEGVVSLAYNESILVYYGDDGVHTMDMASEKTKLIIERWNNDHERTIYTSLWDDIMIFDVFESYDDENGENHLDILLYAFRIDSSELTELKYIKTK